MRNFDVVVVGAGAAGMMCAIEAGRRGRRVLVVDHAEAPGKKIRISGGGRCNFTNIHTGPAAFLSQNPRFAISALKRFTPSDFVARVNRRGIAWHEKALGQLFCDGSAQQIIDLLVDDLRDCNASLELDTSVTGIARGGDGFEVGLSSGPVSCQSLVIATGGKSIPKMGATGFAYDVARQFGIDVTETRPALVPLTFEQGMLARLKPLAGVSADVVVSHGKTKFAEAMLFTHRGLSGPAILQISSYWRAGDEIVVNLAPGTDFRGWLAEVRKRAGKQTLANALSDILPKRLGQMIAEDMNFGGPVADLNRAQAQTLEQAISSWRIKPVGSEGYRTAEVTLGGIDTGALSSQDMQVKAVPGLFFIGEAVDVTGWLGGYNFQWAWSSGWSAGQVV